MKSRIEAIGEKQHVVVCGALVIASVLSIALARYPSCPPVILLLGTLFAGWRLGPSAGVIVAAASTVLFGFIRSGTTDITEIVLYLTASTSASLVVGVLRAKSNRTQTERDEMDIMLGYAPIGFALFGLDRRVIRCNRRYREIYGWNDEEIIGRTPPMPESQRESWGKLLDKLRAGESFVNEETVREQKDGGQFYARISGSPVFDTAGTLVAFVGFIAKADGGEHSDQLEVRKLESLVQRSWDFMCIAHIFRKTFFLNDAGKSIVGLAHDVEIHPILLEEFFAPEDRNRVREVLHSLLNQAVGSKTRKLHLLHFHDGPSIPVSCSFYMIMDPLTKVASSFACVARSHDFGEEWSNELVRGEEAFHSLFRNAPVGIALVNIAGEPFESNEMFQELLGYGTDELRQMRFSQLVHPEDLPAGRKLFRSLASGEINRYEVTKRLITRSGEVLWTKMTVGLMRNSDGDPSYSISMVERIPSPGVLDEDEAK